MKQANLPKRVSSLGSLTQTSDGPVAVGTTWHSTQKLFGRRMEGDTEGTEFETNHRYAFSGTVPFPVTVAFTLEPVAGGTRVDQVIEAEPGGFFKLALPVLLTMGKRQLQTDLDNFRDLMDANEL